MDGIAPDNQEMNGFARLPQGSSTDTADVEAPVSKRYEPQQDKDHLHVASEFPQFMEGKDMFGIEENRKPLHQESSLNQLLKEMGQEAKDIISNWSESFFDGERFERFCPTRIDSLTEEAKALEQSLLKQKEQFHQRLCAISQALEM